MTSFLRYNDTDVANATKSVLKHVEKDYNIRNSIRGGIGSKIPHDLSYAILYQQSFSGCSFYNNDMTSMNANGSTFNNNHFDSVELKRASMQYCSFNSDVFYNCKIEDSNFANSTFAECGIVEGRIISCSFVGTTFIDSILRIPEMRSSTFELCTFDRCLFEKMNFKNMTLNYSFFKDVEMKSTGLPFLQLPYTFNGLQYITHTYNDIYITSHSENERMSVGEYIDNIRNLAIFFDKNEQFFPLTNCLLSMGEKKSAADCNYEGILKYAEKGDFRALYMLCRQAAETLSLPRLKRVEIYRHIMNSIIRNHLTLATSNLFQIYYPLIKKALWDSSSNNPIVSVRLNTNIKKNDYNGLSEVLRLLDVISDNSEIEDKHSEIRHNSPPIIDYIISGGYKQIIHALQTLFTVIASISDTITVGNFIKDIANKAFASIETTEQVNTQSFNFMEEPERIIAVRNELATYSKSKSMVSSKYVSGKELSLQISEDIIELQNKLSVSGIKIEQVEMQILHDPEYALDRFFLDI